MVLTESCTDDDLLTAGGADGFAAFYRRHVDAMLRYHARSTRNAEAAADLTAETFAAALEAKARFRAGGPPARAWLFGIAPRSWPTAGGAATRKTAPAPARHGASRADGRRSAPDRAAGR